MRYLLQYTILLLRPIGTHCRDIIGVELPPFRQPLLVLLLFYIIVGR